MSLARRLGGSGDLSAGADRGGAGQARAAKRGAGDGRDGDQGRTDGTGEDAPSVLLAGVRRRQRDGVPVRADVRTQTCQGVPRRVNTPALDEIDYAETNTNLVRVNSWNPEATGSDPSRWRWRVTHGFGDCSAGCIFRDVIEVDVTDKGEVALVSASCASGLPDHLREQQQLAPLCKAYKRR